MICAGKKTKQKKYIYIKLVNIERNHWHGAVNLGPVYSALEFKWALQCLVFRDNAIIRTCTISASTEKNK